MPTYAELAAQLLKDSALFFRTLAGENPAVRQKMTDSAAAFDQAAQALLSNPLGVTGDRPNAATAAACLNEAAKLLRKLGNQNEPIREQMQTNADTFDDIAAKLSANPAGRAG